MYVILRDKTTGEILAYLDDIIEKDSLLVTAAVNGEYFLRFEAVDLTKDELIRRKFDDLQKPSYIDLDGQYFDVCYIEQTHGESLRYSVECEHVSYRLRKVLRSDISLEGTPFFALSSLLRDTEFEVGQVEVFEGCLYVEPREKDVFSMLRDYADLQNAVLGYDGFSIGLYQKPSRDKGFTARFGKNIQSVKKIVDHRNDLVYYSLHLADLRNFPQYKDFESLESVSQGDPIHIIDEITHTNVTYFVISRSYKRNGDTVSLEIANRLELLSDSFSSLSKRVGMCCIVLDHKPTEAETKTFPIGSIIHVYDKNTYEYGLYEIPEVYYRFGNDDIQSFKDKKGLSVTVWSEYDTIPYTADKLFAVFSMGDIVYIAGSLDHADQPTKHRVLVYNVRKKTTTQMNAPGLNDHIWTAAAIAEDTAYLMAVSGGKMKNYGFSPADNVVQIKSEHETVKETAFSISHEGIVYVLGDSAFRYDSSGDGLYYTGNVEMTKTYDGKNDEWKVVSNCPNSRVFSSMCSTNGQIHVLGGIKYDSSMQTDTHQVYDIATDTWSIKPAMPTGRYRFTSQAIGDYIYAIGGTMFDNHFRTSVISTVEIYDTITETWSVGASLPRGFTYISSALAKGRLYVVGGEHNDRISIGYMEQFYSFDTKLSAGITVIPSEDCFVYPSMQTLPADEATVVHTEGDLCSYAMLLSAEIIKHRPPARKTARWRSDTLENWQKSEEIPDKGDGMIVFSDGMVGLKIGDGVSDFDQLSYIVSGGLS